MFKDNNDTYYLTKRDKEIMDILWNTAKPLIAAEIVNSNNSLNMHTVQASLKKLLGKNLIEVAGIDYHGTSLSRSYRPTLSARDYETRKYMNAMEDDADFSASQFVVTFLNHKDEAQELQELQRLEELIIERKRKILEEREREATEGE